MGSEIQQIDDATMEGLAEIAQRKTGDLHVDNLRNFGLLSMGGMSKVMITAKLGGASNETVMKFDMMLDMWHAMLGETLREMMK